MSHRAPPALPARLIPTSYKTTTSLLHRVCLLQPSPYHPHPLHRSVCIKSTATPYQVTPSPSCPSFFSPPASCKTTIVCILKGVSNPLYIYHHYQPAPSFVCYRSIESSSPITPFHFIASYILSGKRTPCLPFSQHHSTPPPPFVSALKVRRILFLGSLPHHPSQLCL